jgi:hypothetical protein
MYNETLMLLLYPIRRAISRMSSRPGGYSKEISLGIRYLVAADRCATKPPTFSVANDRIQ